MKHRKITFGKMVYVFFAVIWLLTTLVPLYFTLISSLKQNNQIFINFMLPPTEPVWENYLVAIKNAGILRAISNSIFVSIISLGILVLCCTMSAYVISRKLVPFSSFFGALFVVALMLPVQSMVVPLTQMVTSVGMNGKLTVLSVLYAGLNSSMTFMIIKNQIDGIPREIDEAAMIDGCSIPQTLFRVILPIGKPALATGAILAFLNIYNELALGQVLINNTQNRTVSVALMGLKSDFGAMYAVIFAGVVIAIIPTIILYLTGQEQVEKSIVTGMLKG